MMQYFDTNIGQVQTTALLAQRGLPPDPVFLRAHGVYPVRYPYPDYNVDLHEMLPDGAPHPDASNADGDYVQDFVIVPLPMPLARARLKAGIAARRYEAEMDGTRLNGFRLATDLDARIRLQTALDACPEGGRILYKLDGEFRSLTHAELSAHSAAIAAHVQACFDREHELRTAIDACENTEALAALDSNAGWPGLGAGSGAAATPGGAA